MTFVCLASRKCYTANYIKLKKGKKKKLHAYNHRNDEKPKVIFIKTWCTAESVGDKETQKNQGCF